MAENEKKKGRGKDFLKSIAGKFVEIQPEGAEVTPKTSVATVTIPVPPSAQTDGATAPVIDDGLLEKFGQVVELANIPGPDYVELLKLANGKNEATGEFVMAGDESARFVSAFRAIKLMNSDFSKEIVLDSIDVYLGILDKEYANAMGELQNMWSRDVDAPEAEVVKLEAEIADMQKRLTELTALASQKRTAVESAKVDIQQKRTNFENTFNMFKSRFVSDKEKLTNIL